MFRCEKGKGRDPLYIIVCQWKHNQGWNHMKLEKEVKENQNLGYKERGGVGKEFNLLIIFPQTKT